MITTAVIVYFVYILHFCASKSFNNNNNFINNCKQYQKTTVSAEATFISGNDINSAYVTDITSFNVKDTNIATIDKNVITAKTIGTTQVGAKRFNDHIVIIPADIEISDMPVTIHSLSVSALTDIDSKYSDSAIEFKINQKLTSIGDTANIAVYANFNDGHYQDVSKEATLTSLSNQFSIVKNDTDGYYLTVTDTSYLWGNYVKATWNGIDGNGKVLIAKPLNNIINTIIHPEIISYTNPLEYALTNTAVIYDKDNHMYSISRKFHQTNSVSYFRVKFGPHVFSTTLPIKNTQYATQINTILIKKSNWNVNVAYQLLDCYNNTQIKLDDLYVTIHVNNMSSTYCGFPNEISGIGMCHHSSNINPIINIHIKVSYKQRSSFISPTLFPQSVFPCTHQYCGIFAYSPRREITHLNLSHPTHITNPQIHVLAITNKCNIIDVTNISKCNGKNKCTNISYDNLDGLINIDVQFYNYLRTITFIIWIIKSIEIYAADNVLNLIT